MEKIIKESFFKIKAFETQAYESEKQSGIIIKPHSD